MDLEGCTFAFPQDKHGETQCWYIWRPSNKKTPERPNVWRSTEPSWTVSLEVTAVSSSKLPGKPLGCGIREGNWRTTEKFPSTQGTNVSQTALSVFPLGLFSKELWTFHWRAGWVLSSTHSTDYCWCLKQDTVTDWHRKKSLKRHFIHEWLLLSIFPFTMAKCELSATISTLNLALFV